MSKKPKKPEDAAWEIFEKTGNPVYYSLYKKLKNPVGQGNDLK